MSFFSHPKYEFTEKNRLLHGSEQSFPNDSSRPRRTAQFQLFIQKFLAQQGITETLCEQGIYSTEDRSEQRYFAQVFSSEEGGCECLLYHLDCDGGDQSIQPSVDLYGSWTRFADDLATALEQYWKK